VTEPEEARRIVEFRDGVLVGERAPQEAVAAALTRMSHVAAEPDDLNLFISVDADAAGGCARDLEVRLGDSEPGTLLGTPIVIGDNLATSTLRTTCGSQMLADYVSPYQATAVQRVRAAGAIVVAKANLDEFGMGVSTTRSAYGATRNPAAPGRVSGGANGGAAAAVAAGCVRVALASDTGGGVRHPAALCGVVGLKPTYGRISRFGLVALAPSLDHVGIVGATVEDVALTLGAVAGHDPLDPTSADVVVEMYVDALGHSLRGTVVGVLRHRDDEAVQPAVRHLCDAAAERFRRLGAEVREVRPPHLHLAQPAYQVIAACEAVSSLARFDGSRFGARVEATSWRTMAERSRSAGFGQEVVRRLLLGTHLLGVARREGLLRRAQQLRALMADDFRTAFASGVHVLFSPTAPGVACISGEAENPEVHAVQERYTAAANLIGVPALSIPVGRADGLPVGGQLIAPHFAERTLFAVASAHERLLFEELGG